MFYQPDRADHGLPFAPFKSLIVPRPIGWISTLNKEGRVNLAPFSQFNILGWDPARVMFSGTKAFYGDRKDTFKNAEETREFVVNMATYDLRHQVARTGAIEDPTVDELAAVGLTTIASRLVQPPRVKESPVHLECRYEQTLTLPCDDPANLQYIVIGRVVGVHIANDCIAPDGRVDILKLRPLARMGYLDYTSVTEVFQLRTVNDLNLQAMHGGRTPRPSGVAESR